MFRYVLKIISFGCSQTCALFSGPFYTLHYQNIALSLIKELKTCVLFRQTRKLCKIDEKFVPKQIKNDIFARIPALRSVLNAELARARGIVLRLWLVLTRSFIADPSATGSQHARVSTWHATRSIAAMESRGCSCLAFAWPRFIELRYRAFLAPFDASVRSRRAAAIGHGEIARSREERMERDASKARVFSVCNWCAVRDGETIYRYRWTHPWPRTKQ